MKKNLKKNVIQRASVKELEKKKKIIKIINYNNFIPLEIRWKVQQYFFSFEKKSSLTQIKNKCILTNRSRSINRLFKLSRIKLRELSSKGLLPGISKNSW